MEWIRGGQWELQAPDERLGLYVAIAAVPRPPGLAGLFPVLLPGGAPPPWPPAAFAFQSDRTRWQSQVGDLVGLTPWEVDGRATQRIFQRLRQFGGMEELERLRLEPLSGHSEFVPGTETVSAICSFLRDFGPLAEVPYVLDVGHDTAFKPGWGVKLWDFAWDVFGLAQSERGLVEAATEAERLDLARLIEQRSRPAFREMEVIPRFNAGRMTWTAGARTLRAHLWRVICDRLGRAASAICMYCDRKFELEPRRGRPPQYCPEHREAKYYQAVHENRAPAQRPQNEEAASDGR